MIPNNEVTAELVIAALIIAGEIKSANYNPAGPSPFSLTGSRFDLTDGDINTPGMDVNGTTGALSVRGAITCTSLTILDGASFPRIAIASISLPPIGGSGFGFVYDDPAFADVDTAAGVVFNGSAGPPEIARTTIFARSPDTSLASLAASSDDASSQVAVAVTDASTGNGAAVTLQGTNVSALIRLNVIGGPAVGQILLESNSLGPWTALPYNAGVWGDFGGGWRTGRYRRVGDIVYVEAVAQNLVATGAGSVIATLPVGFRPLQAISFAANDNAGGGNPRFDVGAAGTILAGLAHAAIGTAIAVTCSFAMS